MRRPYIYFALLLAGVFMALATVNFNRTHASAQSSEKRWVVLFHTPSSLPSDVGQRVAGAGGTVLAELPEVGAVAATSNNPNFATDMANDNKVSDVVEDIEVQMIPTAEQMNAQEVNAEGDGPVEAPGDDTQTGPDPFYTPYQWDKRRIRASNQGSYAVQQGRPEVVVAVLDTGAQVLNVLVPAPHPDINSNLDYARSRSFVPVSANPNGNPSPTAWDDRNGHGTHCMSNVGAPINGIGMVGVAPRVTLVALKVLNNNGSGSFVSLAQALIYAGNNKFDVASMSLGGYLPRNDQSANSLIKLVHRAVNYARSNGVTPVAALANSGYNVSEGDFFRSFIVVPAEISGVIGVSATGFNNQKAGYSNYGVGKTDVSAPGGDFTGPPAPFGLVIGAWASDSIVLPATYVFASGTSMACPQAAGVCALIISQYGDFTPNGNGNKLHMSPTAVESILQQTANNQPCPDTYVVPSQTCQGNAGYNNFYGKGIVDAFKAVTQ